METVYRESQPQLQEISWEDVMILSSKIAKVITSRSFKFDAVVGISRGGIIPARIISDMLLVKDFYVYGVKYYSGINERDEVKVVQRPEGNFKNKNILIVDDIIDTGKTIALVKRELESEVASVKVAALFKKPWSEVEPDFYGDVTDKWVVFPWEVTETKAELEKKGPIGSQERS
ncbi:MAG: phosphoribosyltransferase [Thermoprotei archaeon]|jgi:hypoxanthine phosphoribosyltransferase